MNNIKYLIISSTIDFSTDLVCYRLLANNRSFYRLNRDEFSKHEIEVETAISGKKVKIPAGNKVIIGADKLAHHIRDGMIQPIAKNIKVDGYDAEGLAEYLMIYLKNRYPLEEFFEDYDIDENDFKEEIEFALDEIGLS